MSSLTIDRLFFASSALVLAAACSRATQDPPQENPGTRDEPEESPSALAEPERGLETVSGQTLLAKLRASGRKGTVVNAWASFCGPCKREIPMLERLAEKLRPRGIDVVLVSVDEPADQPKAEAFLRERGIRLTSYVAERPLGPFKRAMNPRWPGMLPASFLFDREAVLRYYWGGEAFEGEVLPVLEAFADGKPIEGESNPVVAPENAE